MHTRFQYDFLARFQSHFRWTMNAKHDETGLANRLAFGVRHGGPILVQELIDVLELHRFLADVANSNHECDRLAVGVGPLLTRFEAQARLQAADFLAPGGEGFLLRRFRRFRSWLNCDSGGQCELKLFIHEFASPLSLVRHVGAGVVPFAA